MNEELQALGENDVWIMVVPPRGCRVLHTKWVFKIKTDAACKIERFKARLVSCENEQDFGIDYGLTFAVVMELSTVKVIMVLDHRWKIRARHGGIPNASVEVAKEEYSEIFFLIILKRIYLLIFHFFLQYRRE